MRYVLLLIAVVLCLGSTASAGVCAAVSYDNYKAGGFSCTVGPLTFTNFTSTYTNAHDLSNADITDSSVTVSIINLAGQYGLEFALGAGMAVRDNGSGGQTGQTQFTFDVAGPALAFAGIAISGTRDGNGTNATFTANVSGTALSTNVATGPTTDRQPLPGTPASVSVSDDARATIPGGNLQQAQIQSIQNTFTPIPEPGSAVSLTGLLAVFWWGRHSRGSNDRRPHMRLRPRLR